MTRDVPAAKRFYSEVVGWTANDVDMGEGVTYTLLKSGDTDRAGLMGTPPGVEAPPHWLTYIGTGDVDATTTRAKELGGSVFKEPTDIPNMGRFAVLADPTGAVFGVFQGTGQPES
jgi:predicted enzyme related to lactoylglutathione lyase